MIRKHIATKNMIREIRANYSSVFNKDMDFGPAALAASNHFLQKAFEVIGEGNDQSKETDGTNGVSQAGLAQSRPLHQRRRNKHELLT